VSVHILRQDRTPALLAAHLEGMARTRLGQKGGPIEDMSKIHVFDFHDNLPFTKEGVRPSFSSRCHEAFSARAWDQSSSPSGPITPLAFSVSSSSFQSRRNCEGSVGLDIVSASISEALLAAVEGLCTSGLAYTSAISASRSSFRFTSLGRPILASVFFVVTGAIRSFLKAQCLT
jgi:hypothetical protein